MAEEQLARIDASLRERLIDAQKRADSRALCVKEPERWLRIAAAYTQGASKKQICRQLHTDRRTLECVIYEIAPCVEEYRESVARNVEVTYSMVSDGLMKWAEDFAENPDAFDEKKAKAFKDMTVSVGLHEGAAKRMRGGADVTVAHRKAKTPEELAEDFDAFLRENVREAELVEDNEEDK